MINNKKEMDSLFNLEELEPRFELASWHDIGDGDDGTCSQGPQCSEHDNSEAIE